MDTDAAINGTRIVTVTDCGVDTAGSGLTGHIAAVFIVAAVGAAGFLLPSLSRPLPASKEEQDDDNHHHLHVDKPRTRGKEIARALFAAGQFGATAVLLNVGLIHSLGDASDHLSSPCLQASFTGAFPDFAVLTTSAAIMVMMLLDHATLSLVERLAAADRKRGDAAAASSSEPETTTTVYSVIGRRNGSAGNGNGALETTTSQGYPSSNLVLYTEDTVSVAVSKAAGGGCHHPLPTGGSTRYRRAVVALVEATVCTHSVPVGLALGLQMGNGFLSLAIAICIHQFLEGFAVGAAVLEAGHSRSSISWYALFFAVTAPSGIALGAGLRSVMSPNSSPFLLTVGFVNAVAAGMLIYVALRHVNAFDSQASYLRREEDGGEGAPLWASALCLFSFIAFGVAIMVIGKWA